MEWLKEHQEEWDKTEIKSGKNSGGRIPDGKHRAVIADCSFDEEMRAVKYRVGFPDLNDRSLGKNTFLFAKDGSAKFNWVKDEMAILGEKEVKLENIQVHCAAVIGKAVNVTVVTPEGKNYSNIYFNEEAKVHEDDAPSTW